MKDRVVGELIDGGAVGDGVGLSSPVVERLDNELLGAELAEEAGSGGLVEETEAASPRENALTSDLSREEKPPAVEEPLVASETVEPDGLQVGSGAAGGAAALEGAGEVVSTGSAAGSQPEESVEAPRSAEAKEEGATSVLADLGAAVSGGMSVDVEAGAVFSEPALEADGGEVADGTSEDSVEADVVEEPGEIPDLGRLAREAQASQRARDVGAGQLEAEALEGFDSEELDFLGVEESSLALQEERVRELEEALGQKDAQIADFGERVLRLHAEFDNFKKRVRRERTELIRSANEKLLKELLLVADAFEAALKSCADHKIDASFVKGFDLIFAQMMNVFMKFGLKPIEAVGQPFDPNIHEAVMMEEGSELPENTVVRDFRRGYLLQDKVIRQSMVAVAKRPSSLLPAPEDLSESAVEPEHLPCASEGNVEEPRHPDVERRGQPGQASLKGDEESSA